MVREEKLYRDEFGRIVKTFTPVGTEGATLFAGKVRVRVTPPPPMNAASQVFERDFEFPMTDDVTSVAMAFEKFDEVCKIPVEEKKAKKPKPRQFVACASPEGLKVSWEGVVFLPPLGSEFKRVFLHNARVSMPAFLHIETLFNFYVFGGYGGTRSRKPCDTS